MRAGITKLFGRPIRPEDVKRLFCRSVRQDPEALVLGAFIAARQVYIDMVEMKITRKKTAERNHQQLARASGAASSGQGVRRL